MSKLKIVETSEETFWRCKYGYRYIADCSANGLGRHTIEVPKVEDSMFGDDMTHLLAVLHELGHAQHRHGVPIDDNHILYCEWQAWQWVYACVKPEYHVLITNLMIEVGSLKQYLDVNRVMGEEEI